MKTIAEFKRKIQQGVQIHTVYHKEFSHRLENGEPVYKDKDLGIREIANVQTTQFGVNTKRSDTLTVVSWCNFPKAKEVIFLENGLTILEEDYQTKKLTPILTYTFIN